VTSAVRQIGLSAPWLDEREEELAIEVLRSGRLSLGPSIDRFEELFAAATTNRSNLTALVRSEVDIAVTRLGLVSAEKLEEARAEVARLRAEVARLRSASSRADISHSTANKAAAPKRAAKRVAKATSASSAATTTNAAARPTVVTKTPKTARTATRATTARRPAVTTRAKPAAT